MKLSVNFAEFFSAFFFLFFFFLLFSVFWVFFLLRDFSEFVRSFILSLFCLEYFVFYLYGWGALLNKFEFAFALLDSGPSGCSFFFFFFFFARL